MSSENHQQAVLQKQSHRKTSRDWKLAPNWLQRQFSRAPIRWKISLGYALVLSIAVLGTTVGQLVGNFHTRKAWDRLNLEQDEAQLLSELKIAVVETQSHQQKLVILMEYPDSFNHEKDEYFAHQKQVNQLFYKLKILVARNFNKDDTEIVDLNQFLQAYDATQRAYSQQLDRLLQEIDPKRLSREQVVELYQKQYPNPSGEIQAETEAIDLDFLADDFSKLIHSMKNGADRIRQIVLSLRNFSRLDESQLKFANIHEGIDSTLVIVNQRLEQKIAVIKDYGDLPLVKCYPALLNQVFMNIIENAIWAIEERNFHGKDSSCETHKPTIWIHTKIIDSELVKIIIRDNGTGIAPELKNKIFDPFFTTKDVGKGTGLGLTVCYQAIEKHKGKLEVFSELREGAEFCITLSIKPSDN